LDKKLSIFSGFSTFFSFPYPYYGGGENMKKITIVTLIVVILVFPISYNAIGATIEQPKLECIRKVELKMAEFQDQVLEDVFTSFDLPFDLNKRTYYITFHDLTKFRLLHPQKESDIESLTPFLTGASIGEKRVYFLENNPHKSVVLFKDINGNNHKVSLKRTEDGWIKVNQQVSEGQEMQYKKLKCEEEYHLQQFFNDLFKK
jgi:hypothetical protein